MIVSLQNVGNENRGSHHHLLSLAESQVTTRISLGFFYAPTGSPSLMVRPVCALHRAILYGVFFFFLMRAHFLIITQ